jgi:hypothetical protein
MLAQGHSNVRRRRPPQFTTFSDNRSDGAQLPGKCFATGPQHISGSEYDVVNCKFLSQWGRKLVFDTTINVLKSLSGDRLQSPSGAAVRVKQQCGDSVTPQVTELLEGD